MISIDLKDKVAFVTGAGRGIGKEIAICLAKAGANIAAADIITDILSDTLSEVKNADSQAIALKTDVADYQSVESAMENVVGHFGKIDILVNNAGITRDGLILRLKDEDWVKVIDVNLKGTFNCIKSASRYMIKNCNGRIINIASISGIIGNAGQSNYSASKAGIIALTKTAARELAPRGITVNAIAPGFIATDMTAKISEEIKHKFISSIPLGRAGEPRDVANAVLFLASSLASYITGHTIIIDGGLVMA